MRRATCPCCGRTVNAQGVDGRLVFVPHRTGRMSVRCEASLWLVEDDELVR